MNRWENRLQRHKALLPETAVEGALVRPQTQRVGSSADLLCPCRPSAVPLPLGIQPEKLAWAESASHPAEPQLSRPSWAFALHPGTSPFHFFVLRTLLHVLMVQSEVCAEASSRHVFLLRVIVVVLPWAYVPCFTRCDLPHPVLGQDYSVHWEKGENGFGGG